MNFTKNNHPKELFIEPATGSPGEFYINVSPEEFSPAIATVFNNKYADVSEEDSRINASYFAALPQFIEVTQKAIRITDSIPGRSANRDLTKELEELRLLCDAVIENWHRLLCHRKVNNRKHLGYCIQVVYIRILN